MATLEDHLNRLKELQIETAVGSLEPKEGKTSEFWFGWASGLQAGLKLAIAEFETPEGEDDGEKPARAKR